MPKVILEFNLPEEEQDLKLAQRGSAYYCVIWEALQEIRNYTKYKEISGETYDALKKIRDILSEAQIEDIE